MSRPTPAASELRIPLSGRQIVKQPPKSALTPRRGKKSAVFDPSTVEIQADSYDFVNPGGSEGEQLLSARNPGLLAIRRKAEQTRPKTALQSAREKKQKRDVEIISPRGNTSLLQKRPMTALKDTTRKVTETITREINTEKLSLAFDEDPVAYFSKRKDGRGHRFIYLNQVGDGTTDPFFNPYELVKVPFAELNPDYFTMSANGVTHVMSNGTTEHIPIDRWANESSRFAAIRKLKMFAQFFYWRPFKMWKKFVMRQRFTELAGSILAHPFFTHPGFYATQLLIMDIPVDKESGMRVEDMMHKYFLALIPQARFEIPTYHATINQNSEILSQMYSRYVTQIQNEILNLDARIRDPKILQVKDSDFPEIKRRNPNLGQLMLLEKKKAERRVELTKKVNDQIIALGYFIRDIDYMLVETLASSVYDCWHQAATSIASDMSAIFQVEVSFSDDGKVVLSPTLPELIDTIHESLQEAIRTVNGLPRLLNATPLKAHIRESHPDYKNLIDNGPRLKQMVEKDDDLKNTEQRIIDVVSASYRDAVIASQVFQDFFSVYEIGRSWNVMSYISTRSGRPLDVSIGNSDGKKERKDEDGGFRDLDFGNEPVVDMRKVRDDIELFKKDDKRLQQFSPCTVRGALYINSKKIRAHLNPIPLNTLNTLSKTLKQLLVEKVERIQRALIYYGKQLKIEPSKLDQFVAFCELITKTASMTPTINQEINFIDELYRLFDEFCLNMDATEQNQNTLPPQMALFITAQEIATQTKKTNMEKFTGQLKDLTKKLEGKLQKYMDMATSQPSTIAETDTERLKTDVDHLRQKIIKIRPEIAECKRYQNVLNVDYCQFTGYGDVIESLDFAENLYIAVELWQEVDTTAMKVPFHSIDIEAFVKDITSLKKQVDDLTTMSRIPTALLMELSGRVQSVYPYFEQIRYLAGANMQPRHWQALFDEVNLPNAYHKDIRLEELIQMGILVYKEKIQEQSSIAKGESQLENEFKQVFTRWSVVQLPLLDGQIRSEDSLLLDDVAPMIAEIEDSVIALTRMSALPFVHGIREQIVKLQVSLEASALILDAWKLFQHNWLMCGALFAHEDSKSLLQSQSGRFTWVRRRWVTIVRHSLKDLSLLAVCSYPNLLEMTKENNAALEGILSSLGLYVDSKRTVLPRLFTLGNSDILSLIAGWNTAVTKRLITRLFMNMVGLDATETESSSSNQQYQRIRVLGMVGNDGDTFMLPKYVMISGSVEHWVPLLAEQLKQVFMTSLCSVMTKFKSTQMSDWILTVPTHVTMLALTMSFCTEIDECFDQFETNVHSFSNYESVLKKKFTELVSLLETPLSPLEVTKAGMALSIISGQMDLIRYLASDKESKRFWWNQMLRIKWDANAQRVQVINGDEFLDFGWEMWGSIRPFIMSPATMRVLHNVPLDKCPMIVGSEGTGRSQVIEYLAAVNGRFMYQLPAFPDMKGALISRVVAGSVAMGAWTLFSNIDKLPFSAMSYLHDCLHVYAEGLSANNSRIIIDNKPVELNPYARLFMTAGSVPESLPPQLMARVKPIALSAPERRIIVETKLAVHGFKHAKHISQKLDICVPAIVNTFSGVLKSAAVFTHMNSIIAHAGRNVRETKEANFSRTFDTSRDVEEFTAARATFYHFAGAIDRKDHGTIYQIIHSAFHIYENIELFKTAIETSGCFKEEIEINSLAAACSRAVKPEMPKDYIVQQSLSLFQLLRNHRCVILHGPPSAGKSSVLDVLTESCNGILADERAAHRFKIIKKIKMERIFHASKPYEKMFGELQSDPATGCVWAHGLLSSVVNTLRGYDNCMKILVFDGPMSDKFQQLLSGIILNDSGRLNSLDTLTFGDDFRIVVETGSIASMRPDLIQKVGFLSMNNVQNSTSSECEFVSAEPVLSKVFDRSIHAKIVPIFEEVMRLVIKYVYHRDNCAYYAENPKIMQHGALLLTDHLPTVAAKILRGMVESGDIDMNVDAQLRLGICYAVFMSFSTVFSQQNTTQFDTWLRSSFHIIMSMDWSNVGVPVHFSDIFPKPCFQTHSIVSGSLKPLNMSVLDTKAMQLPGSNTFIENMVVPNAYFVYLTHAFNTYLRMNENIIFTGGDGKRSFLKYFFNGHPDYAPVFVPTGMTPTGESLYRFLDVHTSLTQKFSIPGKRTVLIFENVSAENTEVMEMIRQIVTSKYVLQSSTGDANNYTKVVFKNFLVIVTTREFSELPSRFAYMFAPIANPAITTDVIRYTLGNILSTYEVKTEFATKIADFMKAAMHQVEGFKKTLPFAELMISSICRMKERKCLEEGHETLLLKTVLSELDSLVLRSKPSRISEATTIINEFFSDEKGISVLSDKENMCYPEFSLNGEGTLSVTSACHGRSFIKEELEFYLQVYNNSATEKIVLKFIPSVIRQWGYLHRVLTAPGGCALITGAQGSGRFTLTRFVAHMSEYDFVNISTTIGESINARDYLYTVLRDVVTNCALLNKRNILFVRHTGKTVSQEMKIILDFMNTRNFTPFFSKTSLEDFYLKFSSSQSVRPDQRAESFEKIQNIIRTNFHICIAADKDACELPDFRGIVVNFEDFTTVDQIEAAQSAMEPPIYKNILGNYKAHLPQVLQHLHAIATSAIGKVHQNQYYDLLDNFCHVVTTDYQKLVTHSGNLLATIQFLISLEEESQRVDRQLDSISPTLQKLTTDADALQVSFSSKREAIQARRKQIDAEMESRTKDVTKAQHEVEQYETEINGLLPIVRQTQRQIEQLTVNDIETIRITAAEPSPALKLMLEVLCIFVDLPISYDKGGYKLLMDKDFVQILVAKVRYQNISSNVIQQVMEYFKDPNFTKEAMETVAPALENIFDWISAICKYSLATDNLQKKVGELDQRKRSYNEALEEAKLEQQSIQQVETSLEDEVRALDATMVSKSATESEYEAVNNRKKNIDTILKDMEELLEKWQQESASITSQREVIVGDALFYSFYITYCGMINGEHKDVMIKNVFSEIQASGYNLSFENAQEFMNDRFVHDIFDEGLYQIEHSYVHDGFIDLQHVKNSIRPPLIIDQDGLIEFFFTKGKKQKNMIISSMSVKNLDNVITTAMQEGRTLVLFDVDRLHPCLIPVLSLMRLVDKENISKDIRIGAKMTTWDPKFKLIMFTNHRNIRDIPESLFARTSVIDVSESSHRAVRTILETTFVEFFSASLLPRLAEIQKMSLDSRVGVVKHEHEIIESIAEAVAAQTADASFDFLNDEESMRDVNQSKELYFSACERLDVYEKKEKDRDSITSPYAVVIDHIMNVWTAVSRYIVKLSPYNKFNYAAFVTVVSNSLQMPGVNKGQMNPEQQLNLQNLITQQIMLWVQPTISFRDSSILMFMICVMRDIHKKKFKISDLDTLISHVSDEANASFEMGSVNPGSSEPLEHMKFSNIRSVFHYFSKYISEPFGTEFANNIPFFQVENIISPSAAVPTIIISSANQNPSQMINQFIATKTRGDNFEPISLFDDPDLLRNIQKVATTAMTRGTRLLLHIPRLSAEIGGLLSEIYQSMMSTSLHTNFRLIISVNSANFISHRLLIASRRLVYNDFPSVRHQMVQIYHHYSTVIRSSTNPKAIKKIAYAAALCFALLHYREFIVPIGYNSLFEIRNSQFRDFVETIRPIVDSSGAAIPIKTIRDYLQDTIMGSTVVDAFDRRRIRALIFSVFDETLLDESFNFLRESSDNEKWIIPHDLPLSNFTNYCQKLPSFPYGNCLMMMQSITDPLRDWNLSRWIANGISGLSSTPKPTLDAATLYARVDGYLMSIPSPISTASLAKSPIMTVLKAEIDTLNSLLGEIKTALSASVKTSEAEQFISGTIPMSWREAAGFDTSASSPRFLAFLSEKREFLLKCVRSGTLDVVDVRLFNNIKGLLFAHIVERVGTRSLTSDAASIEFTIMRPEQTQRPGSIILRGISLLSGAIDDTGNLVLNAQTKTCHAFPDLMCTVVKSAPKGSKIFQCPLFRSIWIDKTTSRPTLRKFVDGQPANLVWYVPLTTDNTQVELVANGTALVCVLPEQFAQ